MLFQKGPGKVFYKAFRYGVFTTQIDTAPQAPTGYLLLIDNDADYLDDNSSKYLMAPDV